MTPIRALMAIRDYEPDLSEAIRIDKLMEAHRSCKECARWSKTNFSVQHSCDGWYSLRRIRDMAVRDAEMNQHLGMRRIATEALLGKETKRKEAKR